MQAFEGAQPWILHCCCGVGVCGLVGRPLMSRWSERPVSALPKLSSTQSLRSFRSYLSSSKCLCEARFRFWG